MIGEEGVAGKLRGSIGRLQTVSQDRQLTQGQTKALNSYITSLLKYVEDLERNNQKVNSLTELKDLERQVTEENIKAQKEELEARKRFQKDAYLSALRDRQLMADTTVEGLTQLRASGVGITGAQIAAAKQEARRSTIAGGGKANSIEGFTESFRFNSADAAFAIDDAMTELGASIKDSTKTAIQDIASGASSFKEAFGSIMASIADNIANRGIDMGVDTLFGFLAKSKGGPIPRGYNIPSRVLRGRIGC